MKSLFEDPAPRDAAPAVPTTPTNALSFNSSDTATAHKPDQNLLSIPTSMPGTFPTDPPLSSPNTNAPIPTSPSTPTHPASSLTSLIASTTAYASSPPQIAIATPARRPINSTPNPKSKSKPTLPHRTTPWATRTANAGQMRLTEKRKLRQTKTKPELKDE